MAAVIYPKYKEALLTGSSNISLTSGNVKAVLVDTADYTYSATHEFYSSLTSAGRVAISPNLGTKTVTNGLFDAADTTFSAVTGDVSEAIVIFIDTGTEGTSRLVAYLDSGTGLPVTPNGGDINVAWNASGIFQL